MYIFYIYIIYMNKSEFPRYKKSNSAVDPCTNFTMNPQMDSISHH